MRKQKLMKQVSLVLAVCLGAVALQGCGEKKGDTAAKMTESKTENAAGAETAGSTGKADTLKLFLPRNKDIVDGSYAKTEIEKRTNTKLDIMQVTTSVVTRLY